MKYDRFAVTNDRRYVRLTPAQDICVLVMCLRRLIRKEACLIACRIVVCVSLRVLMTQFMRSTPLALRSVVLPLSGSRPLWLWLC